MTSKPDPSSDTGKLQPTVRATWLSRQIATWTLCLPRYSPMKWQARGLRKQLLAAGALPFQGRSRDGQCIDALYLQKTNDCGGKLPVIMNHGYLETKEFHAGEANLLRHAGHDVILYDLRGHGQSGGRHTTLGVHECDDLTAIIDEAQQKQHIGSKVITLGYSTGAAVVIQQAPHDPRVVGVIALTPFAGMRLAVQSFRAVHGAWYNEEKLLRGFEVVSEKIGFDMARSDTIEAVRKFSVPLLLAVGDRDIHLPPGQHAQVLHKEAPPGVVEFHLVPNRGHISIYRQLTDELKQAIIAFCNRISKQKDIP